MLRLLRAESLKLYKDKTFILALLALLGSPLLTTAVFLFGKADIIKRGWWTFDWFIGQSQQMTALMMGPMMMAVIGAYVVTIENRQKTIKGLLPLPTSLAGLFMGKAVVTFVSVVIGMMFMGAVTVFAAFCMGLSSHGSHAFWQLAARLFENEALLSLGFTASLAFTMFISLFAKNFVVTLGVALVAQIGGMFALQGDKGHLFWTSLPVMISNLALKGKPVGDLTARALVFTAIFIAAGLIWAKFTPRPE